MREVPGRLVLVENQRQSQAIGHFYAFYRESRARTNFVRNEYGTLAPMSLASTQKACVSVLGYR